MRRAVFVMMWGAMLSCGGGDESTGTDTDTDALPTASSPGTFPDDDEDDTNPPGTFTTTTTTGPDPSTTSPTTEPPTTEPPTTEPPTTEPPTTEPPTTRGSSESGEASESTAGSSSSDSGETDPTVGDAGQCCEINEGNMGCDEPTVEACVCARDPYCCETGWDDACVVSVVIHGCGTCEGVGGDGDCCAANDTPGCDDDEIQACVCEADTVCCLEPWDETCAQGVEFELCGKCPA